MERSAFSCDAGRDRYVSPEGNGLKRVELRQGVIRSRARLSDWSRCAMKANCTTGKFRSLSRAVHGPVRERVRPRETMPGFAESQRWRWRIGRPFGTIKRAEGLRPLRLRGLQGADEQFLLAATARNLRRMVCLLGTVPPSSQGTA